MQAFFRKFPRWSYKSYPQGGSPVENFVIAVQNVLFHRFDRIHDTHFSNFSERDTGSNQTNRNR